MSQNEHFQRVTYWLLRLTGIQDVHAVIRRNARTLPCIDVRIEELDRAIGVVTQELNAHPAQHAEQVSALSSMQTPFYAPLLPRRLASRADRCVYEIRTHKCKEIGEIVAPQEVQLLLRSKRRPCFPHLLQIARLKPRSQHTHLWDMRSMRDRAQQRHKPPTARALHAPSKHRSPTNARPQRAWRRLLRLGRSTNSDLEAPTLGDQATSAPDHAGARCRATAGRRARAWR